MDYKLQILGIKSHLELELAQMESLDDNPELRDAQQPHPYVVNASEREAASPVSLSDGGRKTIGNAIYKSIKTVVLSKKFNLLIPFGPLAILVQKKTGQNGWVFILGLLGRMPLAERLSYTTEQLAFYGEPTVGGVLNATFGNATELILSIYALRTGKIRIVQLSLLGSLLSNFLFVLGCAFFFGGIVRKKQEERQNGENSDDVEEEAPEISKWESVIWLAIVAAVISILSEYLVDAIEGASLAWGVPVAFISVILLPIGGNTAAVTTSVMFAMKNKLDVSLGVAIGSSTQVSMFLVGVVILFLLIAKLPCIYSNSCLVDISCCGMEQLITSKD
ncbi:hypothetical protein DITRI_Ditri01bG0203500 [Diplodiscus trichospermus]